MSPSCHNFRWIFKDSHGFSWARFWGFFYFSLKVFLFYAARKGYSALPLTFPSSPGDKGFVDICCMPCCYYKSEATFQASAHSELSCTGKRTMENINGKNWRSEKRTIWMNFFILRHLIMEWEKIPAKRWVSCFVFKAGCLKLRF